MKNDMLGLIIETDDEHGDETPYTSRPRRNSTRKVPDQNNNNNVKLLHAQTMIITELDKVEEKIDVKYDLSPRHTLTLH